MMDEQNQAVTYDNFLHDGKNDWKGRKMETVALSEVYLAVDGRKAARLHDCGTVLGFARKPDGGMSLQKANFCHLRLCPMCQWRRARKVYGQMAQIIDYMSAHGSYRYIFVTLTLRNCQGVDLADTLDKLFAGYNRLARYPEFNQRRKGSAIRGWYRTLEVTHNVDSDSPSYDTYHPHLHVLYAVSPKYFWRNYDRYCTHDRLVEIWRQAAGLDYDPQVSIEAVKPQARDGDNQAMAITRAIAEVSKYAAKSHDYVIPDEWDLSVESVRVLDRALTGRRLVSFGGVMRDTHRLLHLDNPDDGDLIHVDPDSDTVSDDEQIIYYVWRSGYGQVGEYILDT